MTKLEKIQIAQDKTAKMQHGLETVQDTLDKAEIAAEAEELDLEECNGAAVLAVVGALTVTALVVGTIIIIRKRRNMQEDEDWSE